MPALILVHIGNEFPVYINDCISQLQSVSDIEIHLLINNIHTTKIKDKITVVPLETIKAGAQRITFERTSRLDSRFRGGFWKYAMLRFFYIYDYIVSMNLENIFHIENDNLIYMDFLKNIEIFQTKSMWCVMDSPDRCIPSFLYFKNSSILSRLLQLCITQSSTGSNDMFALGKFRNTFKEEVGVLPTIGSYIDPINPMFYENAPRFQCLFDAAAVGQYIGGIDPRNDSKNTIGFINDVSPFKCNKAKVEWRNSKPYLNDMPLVNLHIHSKDLKRWLRIE